MAVKVNLGQCAISRAGQGPFVSTLRSTGRVDVAAASVSNPRRDLVVAQVLDASIGDADTKTRVFYIAGAAAGSPVLPAIPTGAIPLAELQVAANATQILTANIIDMRKAAGIRGAIRLMLPGDSHADVGSYPGDARYCRTHEQVEVWRADNLWHGTQPVPVAQPSQIASGALAAGTSVKLANTMTIADPGFPYRVKVWGGVLASTVATGSVHELLMQINRTDGYLPVSGGGNTPDPNTVSWSSLSMPVGGQMQGFVPPDITGVLTGNQSFYFWIRNNAGGAMTILQGYSYKFRAEILPA
jgi:hypothetical protein